MRCKICGSPTPKIKGMNKYRVTCSDECYAKRRSQATKENNKLNPRTNPYSQDRTIKGRSESFEKLYNQRLERELLDSILE